MKEYEKTLRNIDILQGVLDNQGANPGFVRPENCTIFGAPLKKKEQKITNRKFGTKFNIF